jgi:hypothetical protein
MPPNAASAAYGMGAIMAAIAFLVLFLGNILWHIGSALTMLVTLADLPCPIGVMARDLSRGIRAEEPLTDHRGQHQQPRRRAVDRLRPARPGGVHQLLRHAALGAAGRRPGAGAAGRCRRSSSPPAPR